MSSRSRARRTRSAADRSSRRSAEGSIALDGAPAIVVKLDADVSFEPDHFARLTGGVRDGPHARNREQHLLGARRGDVEPEATARSHVRGAVRAYRWACLQDVTPLERRFGWDTIDELKAQLHGWSTRTVAELAFFHHRATGARDGGRRTWEAPGQARVVPRIPRFHTC